MNVSEAEKARPSAQQRERAALLQRRRQLGTMKFRLPAETGPRFPLSAPVTIRVKN